jgi:plasmid stabilization system protein ParE
MRIEFHHEALRELIDAARYYESKLPGLGTDFRSEVDRSLQLLNENPAIGAVVEATYRRLLLDRFPFSVIYRTKDSTLRILAIAHQRRRPGYWKSRE